MATHTPTTPLSNPAWAEPIRALDAALRRLEPTIERLEAPRPRGQEWYELLERKLLPQVAGPPLIVAAVVGGTNIGKSAIFNQLAGEEASGVSPLAAGTKHPVCLVPAEAADEALLAGLFEGFVLRRWQAADEPLAATEDDPLFWRVGPRLPPRLLVLDTPDIDSDVEVNWQRADYVRRAADVLIAVLTQQKYNDAAVKRFFRAAAAADKTVIVVFNQCDLQADRAYWPQWLQTFCHGTGITPHAVYVVPLDRAAVARRGLPFYDVGRQGDSAPGAAVALENDLCGLAFDDVKRRALRGAALRVVDPRDGAPALAAELRAASARFAAAAKTVSSVKADHLAWPRAPEVILKEEIRTWWDERRPGWSKGIHNAYRAVGRAVTQAGRAVVATLWSGAPGTAATGLDEAYQRYQRAEHEAILHAVGLLVDKLQGLADVGPPLLAERLRPLLSGAARTQLIQRVEEAHGRLEPVSKEYQAYLRAELDRWASENPRLVRVLESLDQALALARPAITLGLAVGGAWVVAPLLPLQAAVDTAVTVGTGEALVATSGAQLRRAAAQLFQQLQEQYARRRAQWLGEWLEREFLGAPLDELRRGAAAAESPELADFESAVERLRAAFAE